VAKKEISLVVTAKNAVAAGLKSAGASINKFGSSVATSAKRITAGLLAAGTAVVAFATKAIAAYSVQEKATADLRSAFSLYGEEVDNNTKKVEAFAAAMQQEAGVGDELIIKRAAMLKM